MSKPFHIIVADDDDDDQFIIKEAIKEFNNHQIQVTSVYDGSQLIDCLNKKGLFAKENLGKTDLILLDINMPILNGLEALSKIKSDKTMKDIPVYMISTMRTIEKMDACLSLGASNFYSKPNHISGYKNIIEEIFTSTLYAQHQF
jgi:CheY-like chemotaxis protein